MKKSFIFISLLISVFLIMALPYKVYAQTNMPTRIINVVYDDSGSMIEAKGQKVDTWCQAKYSMEVFAAMLGEKDTMNIYVMSDYDKGKSAETPMLSLYGLDGNVTNVAKIHEMITNAGNTPFDSVRKAYEDLEKVTADEKWLVVLTDGEFQNIDNIDDYFSRKSKDIKIMFLGMGEAASSITAKDDIYFEKAETNQEILSKITEICTRIFNTDKLNVDKETGKFSFDVPMSELVVFAQGEDVHINGLLTGSGDLISEDGESVSVKYSEVATTNPNYRDFIIDKGLVGNVVTFRGDFRPGNYKVDVANAQTIEIYYKPNIEIIAYLIDEEGQEVLSTDGIEAGEYTLEFGFVRKGSNEKVLDSELLGDIKYSAYLSTGNTVDSKEYSAGDVIVLDEGEYTLDVVANYLKYNSVQSQLQFDVYRNKELLLNIGSNPEYQLDRTGFLNPEDEIAVSVTLEGIELTDEQWYSLGLLEVEQVDKEDRRVDFCVEKSETPGCYYIRPFLVDGKTQIGDYDDIEIKLSIASVWERETWNGELENTVVITDLRSWFWKNIDKVIKLCISVFIIFLILGYIPGIKKYLPKKLKKAPKIECESNVGMRKTWDVRGRFTKNRMSTFTPYVPETGVVRFLPKGVSGVQALKIKAIGSNRIEITNTKAYMGKNNITFDGNPVDEKQKKNLRKTAGMRIKYETKDADYTCVLNK